MTNASFSPQFATPGGTGSSDVRSPAPGRPPQSDAASADSFRATMDRAFERLGGLERPIDARSGGRRVTALEGAMRSTFSSLEHRFASIQRDSLDIGAGFDVTRPESAVLVYERQVRLTSALIEYQCVVQGAENVKNAIKSLTQMQG